MIAKLASISRRMRRAKGAALIGALGAALASGYALAISPTIDSGRTFAGGVAINISSQGGLAMESVYVVPAGQVFTLSDVVASNFSTSGYFEIYVSAATDCASTNMRLNTVIVPGTSTVHLPLVSGVSVASGKYVCVASSTPLVFSLRGFLSNT